jgi:hypothetical protein
LFVTAILASEANSSSVPSSVRPAGPDLGERWPSRLVATAEEDRLNIR